MKRIPIFDWTICDHKPNKSPSPPKRTRPRYQLGPLPTSWKLGKYLLFFGIQKLPVQGHGHLMPNFTRLWYIDESKFYSGCLITVQKNLEIISRPDEIKLCQTALFNEPLLRMWKQIKDLWFELSYHCCYLFSTANSPLVTSLKVVRGWYV